MDQAAAAAPAVARAPLPPPPASPLPVSHSEMLDDSDGDISLLTESSVDDQDDLKFVAQAPCCVAEEDSGEGLDSEDDFGIPIGCSKPWHNS